MDWTCNVAVHESAGPALLRERILAALAQGSVHPHLLYSGLRQSSLWIALHRAWSPAQKDPACIAIYEEAFGAATRALRGNVAHLVSLACGDGTKDVRCLQQIRASNRAAIYTPVDLSLDMVLTAVRESARVMRGLQATPLLADLPHCPVLPAILKAFDPSGAERLLLFLGTLHNYWPPEILRSILYPLRSQDQLLVSANLAPEENYDRALGQILLEYDNPPTRRWLMGALSELGLGGEHGELVFTLRNAPEGPLKRIEACFVLSRARRVSLLEQEIELAAGARLTVFYSYRFTTAQLGVFLAQAGLALTHTWIDPSGREGLFLCKRADVTTPPACPAPP